MNRYPLLTMLVFLAFSWPLAQILPTEVINQTPINLLGYTLSAIGIALTLSAAGLFKRVGTTVNPTKAPDHLVTTGIYQLSRNPMYLGMLLTLIGAQLALSSLVGMIFPISVFLIMNQVVIPREEQMVAGAFGADYAEYKTHTRRWI